MTRKVGINKRLMYAEQILSELLSILPDDLEAIYKMEERHPGTIELAFEMFEDKKPNFSFSLFVDAVKYQSLKEIENLITRDDYESFEDVALDDNYRFWGPIVAYGSYAGSDIEENRKRQELFAEYVRGLITREAFAKRYAKLLPQAKQPQAKQNE